MSTYAERLNATKEFYPFSLWSTYEEMDQYTEENCAAAEAILDQVLARLLTMGEGASESSKLGAMKAAVEALNELNESVGGNLIETSEAEELCELFNRIATAAGLDPNKDAGGEGPASLWRDW